MPKGKLHDFIATGEHVTAVVVGAIRVAAVAIRETHTDLVVDYMSNLSLATNQGPAARYVPESWSLRRNNSVRSKPHIPTPVPEEQQVSVPRFRWKLVGDKAPCAYFKKMPQGGKWKVQKEQNPKPRE